VAPGSARPTDPLPVLGCNTTRVTVRYARCAGSPTGLGSAAELARDVVDRPFLCLGVVAAVVPGACLALLAPAAGAHAAARTEGIAT
jgi:hypothetical protein